MTSSPSVTIILVYVAAASYLVYWVGLMGIHLIAILYGKWKLHRRVDPPDPEKECPGVSVIKPLCGTDTLLLQNLETFFTLKYPKYELLFCVQELDDSITYSYVQSLVEKYPKVESKVFRGGALVGVNPKINNMLPAYRAALHPLVLVSDSSIKMKEDTLVDMVGAMTDNVGLVHQMPYTCDGPGASSSLEKVFFGTFHARMYLNSDLFGINCATGMSALMRKELLDNKGGFEAFGCYLAEDFFFAQAVQEQKYKLAGALASLSSYILFRTDPVCFYLIHVLCWFLADWILIHVVQGGSLPFSKFEFLVMWLFRECGAPYLFLHAISHPSIRWRTMEFRLNWGGKAELVPVRTEKEGMDNEDTSHILHPGSKETHSKTLCPIASSHLIN